MSNPDKHTLQRLLQEFRETGDETLILELFNTQSSSSPEPLNASPASNSWSDGEDQDDTMAFVEVFSANTEDSFSQTSPTFDESRPASSSQTHAFLEGSPYQPTGILGTGGMGTVLQVQDPTLKRTVAMKVLHHQSLQDGNGSFLAEAQISALLQHPSIIPIYEFGTMSGTPYFTMQEIRGQSLKSLLRSPNKPDLRELLTILHTVSKAMAYAHSLGIVHRDLKPSNILVGEFGEVYVVDWGIAVILPTASHKYPGLHPSLYLDPISASIVGTVGYMSPEQAAGANDSISATTDVFAVGSILFEVLTGVPLLTKDKPQPLEWKQKLFNCTNAQAEFRQYVHNELTSSTGLETLCASALEPHPEHRLQSIELWNDSLQQWLNGAIKRQIAERHYQTAKTLACEIQSMEQIISQLIESHPEGEVAERYAHYREIATLREQHKDKQRAREQELHQGILHSPDLNVLHQALVEMEFKRYQSKLEERQYELAADLNTKLRLHLSMLNASLANSWNDKIARCQQTHQQHNFKSPFVGHRDFIDSIQERLHASNVVTIYGLPGSGKSRLAIETCRDMYIQHDIPFHVVPCHDCRNIDDLCASIATAIGVELQTLTMQTLRPILNRRRQTCFVLDGVEPLQETLQAFLTSVANGGSNVLFLITTRNSKQLPDGCIVEMPPLSPIRSMDVFIKQARKVRPSFTITDQNYGTLSSVVKRLQYNPPQHRNGDP